MHNPDINYRSYDLVEGYHKYSVLQKEVKKLGFNNRFAFVASTYRPDLGDDLFVDVELFNSLIQITKDYIGAERIEIINPNPEVDEIPRMVFYYNKQGEVSLFAVTECWYEVGGSEIYHDSMTIAFFSPNNMSEDFIIISNTLSKKLNATRNSYFKASPTPVKAGIFKRIVEKVF